MKGEESRFCKLAECGEPLVRQPAETKWNWEHREFCPGKRCSGIWSALQRKLKKRR